MPGPSKLGRPPIYDRRLILDAIFYVTRSGCTWRELPHDFPHWRLCYYYFAKWQTDGVWQGLNDALRDRVRRNASKKKLPRLRPLTVKALRWLASAESADLMRAKRSTDENDIFSLILWD
jgi:transposase